jgi:hypothetical protein
MCLAFQADTGHPPLPPLRRSSRSCSGGTSRWPRRTSSSSPTSMPATSSSRRARSSLSSSSSTRRSVPRSSLVGQRRFAPRGHEANARRSSPPARAQPLRPALGRLKAIGPSLARRQPSATYRGRLCLASDRLGRPFRAWFAPRDRPPSSLAVRPTTVATFSHSTSRKVAAASDAGTAVPEGRGPLRPADRPRCYRFLQCLYIMLARTSPSRDLAETCYYATRGLTDHESLGREQRRTHAGRRRRSIGLARRRAGGSSTQDALPPSLSLTSNVHNSSVSLPHPAQTSVNDGSSPLCPGSHNPSR